MRWAIFLVTYDHLFPMWMDLTSTFQYLELQAKGESIIGTYPKAHRSIFPGNKITRGKCLFRKPLMPHYNLHSSRMWPWVDLLEEPQGLVYGDHFFPNLGSSRTVGMTSRLKMTLFRVARDPYGMWRAEASTRYVSIFQDIDTDGQIWVKI